MNRNRWFRGAGRLAAGMLLSVLAGCGARISPAELGKIDRDIPKLPGTDKPWPMPELDEPATEDSADAAADAPAASLHTEPAPSEPAPPDKTQPAQPPAETAPDLPPGTDPASAGDGRPNPSESPRPNEE